MKKEIKIEQISQLNGSQDCGPVCVKMILKYFNIDTEIDSLTNQLTYYENGTTAYENGSLLLNAGLKVTAITSQPYLFPPDISSKISSKEDILRIADEAIIKMPKFELGLNTLKKFIYDGGKMQIEIPSFKHIKNAIDEGLPIIALMYAKALGSNEGAFHFVIVAGYDENKVLVVNPSPDSMQPKWFPVEHFLYAVHSSTTYDIDNGTLLIISK